MNHEHKIRSFTFIFETCGGTFRREAKIKPRVCLECQERVRLQTNDRHNALAKAARNEKRRESMLKVEGVATSEFIKQFSRPYGVERLISEVENG